MTFKTRLLTAAGLLAATFTLLSAGPSAATPDAQPAARATASSAAASTAVADAAQALDLDLWDYLVSLLGSDRADLTDAPRTDLIDLVIGDHGTGGNESTQE